MVQSNIILRLLEFVLLMSLIIAFMNFANRVFHYTTFHIQDFGKNNLSVSLNLQNRLKRRRLFICGAEIKFNRNATSKWFLRFLQDIEKEFDKTNQKFSLEININPSKRIINSHLLIFKYIKSKQNVKKIEAQAFQKLEKFLGDTQRISDKIESCKFNTGKELIDILFDLLKLRKNNIKRTDARSWYLKTIDTKDLSNYFTIFAKLNYRKTDGYRQALTKIFNIPTIKGITFTLITKPNKKALLFLKNRNKAMQLLTVVEGVIDKKIQKEIGTAIKGKILKKHAFDLVMRVAFIKSGEISFERGSALFSEIITMMHNKFMHKSEFKDAKDYDRTEYIINRFIYIGHPVNDVLKNSRKIKKVFVKDLLRATMAPTIIYPILTTLFKISNYFKCEGEKNLDSKRDHNIFKNNFFRTSSLLQFKKEGIIYILKQLLSNSLSDDVNVFIRKIFQNIDNNQTIIVRRVNNLLIYDLSNFFKQYFDSYKLFLILFNFLLIGIDNNIKKNFGYLHSASVYYIDRLSDISSAVLRYFLYSRGKKILTNKNKRNLEYIKKIVDFPIVVKVKKGSRRDKEFLIIDRAYKEENQRKASHNKSEKRKSKKVSVVMHRRYTQASEESTSLKRCGMLLQEKIVDYIQKNGVSSWEDLCNDFSEDIIDLDSALNLLIKNKIIQKIKVYFNDFSTTLFYIGNTQTNLVEMYMMKKFSEICNEMGIIIDISRYLKFVVIIEERFVVFFKVAFKTNLLLENLSFVRNKGFDRVVIITPSRNVLFFQQAEKLSKKLNINLKVLPFDYQEIYLFLKNLVKGKRTLQKV